MKPFVRLAFMVSDPKLRPRFGIILSASIVASLFAMWAICIALAYDGYRAEWHRAERFGADVATLIGQDLGRNEELIDCVLRGMVKDTSDPAVMALPTPLRRKVLFEKAAEASGFEATMILDSQGHVVDDSKGNAPPGMDLSDREYFKAQRGGLLTRQPYISVPFESKLTHRLIVTLSRPRLTPDGRFDGVVAQAMTLDYLSKVLRAIHLPTGSTISLVRADGRILMRAPLVEREIGIRLPEFPPVDPNNGDAAGSLVKVSLLDGVERLILYRQVGSLSAYMTVGLSTAEFLRSWHSRVKILGLSVGILSLVILALALALACELRRRTKAEAALQDLALTDSLTLLANRRRLDETLECEWRRAVREDTPISLLMIDADFFKAYNDTFGHIQGDAALCQLADTLRRCCARAGDLVARFGGEEFVVLLPRTDRDGSLRLAKAVHRAVLALALPHPRGATGFLTVSIGAASRRPAPGGKPSMLLQAADAALYKAKAEGRNRTVDEGDEPRFGWRSTREPRVA